jgi:hypothetical protein
MKERPTKLIFASKGIQRVKFITHMCNYGIYNVYGFTSTPPTPWCKVLGKQHYLYFVSNQILVLFVNVT